MYHNDLPDMSEALRQVYEKKQLDSVGAEDKDIDNDGDHDKTDSYLLNRRKKVAKAMGKKTHICAKLVGYKKEEWETIPEQHTMLEDGTVTHYDIKNGDTILENVPVEDLDILISEKHEHFDNYDKNAQMIEGYDDSKVSMRFGDGPEAQKKRKEKLEKKRGMKLDDHPQFKKEAFYFTDEEIADMVEIDEATDEELEEFFIEAIQELAEDEEDLLEICEHLEQVEMLSEEERDAGAMAREKLNKPAGPSRMDRLKSAAKKAGSKLKAGAMKAGAAAKKGIKAAGKSAAANAGKAVGTFQANRIKAKRAELSKKDAPKKEAPKSSSSDDDGTGGKLDALIAKTRGTSGGSSSGGGSSSASSGGGERKGPGLLRRIGSAVKKGLKKAVGKTARAVSGGSDKLAKRLGENYDEIAHLYESGLFSMEEIENVVMELYKGKHGQSEKQYQDGRSDGGKMVSGDSKVSGAAYSSRAVKNTGPNPAGGSKKPQGQGRMTSGARADLQYRKANMKAGK
jgi:hypothetical protein|tara:strand:+ start:245 stop:1777 length:1533 start_codon:yes stop_codon:yes gene_type:complete